MNDAEKQIELELLEDAIQRDECAIQELQEGIGQMRQRRAELLCPSFKVGDIVIRAPGHGTVKASVVQLEPLCVRYINDRTGVPDGPADCTGNRTWWRLLELRP